MQKDTRAINARRPRLRSANDGTTVLLLRKISLIRRILENSFIHFKGFPLECFGAELMLWEEWSGDG